MTKTDEKKIIDTSIKILECFRDENISPVDSIAALCHVLANILADLEMNNPSLSIKDRKAFLNALNADIYGVVDDIKRANEEKSKAKVDTNNIN